MQSDQEVLNRWSGSAPYWEKNREIIRQMFVPITQALAETAKITGGETVLEVATGPGEPALSVAAQLRPDGRVFGIDPIPEMIAAARRASSQLELTNVQFEVASADQLPFPADTFDAVISRFGVMFFPSPLEGIREMLRVLKRGRKLALAVWHLAEGNPFHYVLSRVVDRYIESPPLPPDAPDAFRFASPGKLLKIFEKAGVAAPTERLFKFNIEAQLPPEDFWTLRIEMSDKLREKIRKLSNEQRKKVKREALESLREYNTPSGFSFPAEVLIVSGAKQI